ncbi:MAG: class I tRNA ligase family protein [Eggerthellaceae bacterium]|nr:class I tRNA ligase family protein [Eggerthellaceae bacterium]
MRPVHNWYFELMKFSDFLKKVCDDLEADEDIRDIVPSVMMEFLGPIILYVKYEYKDKYEAIRGRLPSHIFHECAKGKKSFELEFNTVKDRDSAREILSAKNIRNRAGKALVPFRITGNIEWGVKVPEIEGVDGLTFWCWPESLWAPISFTIAANSKRGDKAQNWLDFWCSDDSTIFQFIGQDNIYFYAIVQPALWESISLGSDVFMDKPKDRKYVDEQCEISQSNLVANHHLLFGKKKASSSGDVKPPSADELLDFYTVEQLRTHFVNLGLDKHSVAFCPKAFEPDVKIKNDPCISDPVLKEGMLLTNIFNRLARSCFYEAANSFDSKMPLDDPSANVAEESHKALSKFEELMKITNLHQAFTVAEKYLHFANKHWVDNIKKAHDTEDDGLRRQVLADAFFCLRVACVLMHSSAPFGCEKICKYLKLDPNNFFSWNHGFENNREVLPIGFDGDVFPIETLPPRFDFFRKHDSQYK